jgi:LPXTG-motif cell wall-anchored protein
LVESPELSRDEASTPAPNNVNETELSDEAAPSTSERLPMTGASSLLVVGLAASLLAAGWLVIAGRRRKVVA